MNLPNKITMARIGLSILLILILVFPWYQIGLGSLFPSYLVMNKVLVNMKYVIGGIIFVIAAVTDFLDGHIARSQNLITDFGKTMDAIADKVLVNPILVILAFNGFIPVIVPVVIITRDIVVDAIKMASGSKGKVVAASMLGKIKTLCMMFGIAFIFFYNLPFELIGIRVADILILVATILSVISACQYYIVNKDVIFKEK